MSGICATPSCNDRVYKDANGKPGKYCRNSHRVWGEKGCIKCRKADKYNDTKFCRPCGASLRAAGPILVRVPKDNDSYKKIAGRFRDGWKHPTRCPKVQKIYRIVGKGEIIDKYSAYRNTVEARGRFAAQGIPAGNQLLRWHGTNRKCNLGESGHTSFCSSSQCSLCSIIKTSFSISARKKHGWERFGNGVYTTSTSSKGNDYSKNLGSSPLKGIILARVVAGKVKKYTTDQRTLTRPPAGYDSVVGQPSDSGSLNYDELVVYTNDAVRPSYLVMYDA